VNAVLNLRFYNWWGISRLLELWFVLDRNGHVERVPWCRGTGSDLSASLFTHCSEGRIISQERILMRPLETRTATFA
jgi:hypothetical protein